MKRARPEQRILREVRAAFPGYVPTRELRERSMVGSLRFDAALSVLLDNGLVIRVGSGVRALPPASGESRDQWLKAEGR